MCYRDQTFCNSDCINRECFRNSDHTKHNKMGFPVCWANFKYYPGKGLCKDYIPPPPEAA